MNKSAVFLSIYYKIEKSESPKLGRMFKEEVT